jgi:hypothetical protein
MSLDGVFIVVSALQFATTVNLAGAMRDQPPRYKAGPGTSPALSTEQVDASIMILLI